MRPTALCLCAILVLVGACTSETQPDRGASVSATGGGATATGAGGADTSSVAAGTGGAGDEIAEQTILFIGNSYTYVNDLPGTLSSIAASSGLSPRLTPTSITLGGATFQSHWESPDVQTALAEGDYDVVVLQGQSLEPIESPASFQSYGAQLAGAASAPGAEVLLYQTWARKQGSDVYSQPWSGGDPSAMQDGLTGAYATLAAQTGASASPVGEAFRISLSTHPEIELFAPDGSHPSQEGTYLAACVFYHVLAGAAVPSSAALPAGIDAAEALALQAAAEAALLD